MGRFQLATSRVGIDGIFLEHCDSPSLYIRLSYKNLLHWSRVLSAYVTMLLTRSFVWNFHHSHHRMARGESLIFGQQHSERSVLAPAVDCEILVEREYVCGFELVR